MADTPKDPPPRSTRTPPPPSPSKPAARTPAQKRSPATPRQSPTKEKGSQRRGSTRGTPDNGAGRRSSVGAATAPQFAQPAQDQLNERSDGLANLQSLIFELSAASPSNPTISTSPARSRSRNKNPERTTSPSNATPNLTLPLPASSLNANALGFNSSLGVIHDLRNEGLITPTATSFDLMTGLPRGTALGNNQSSPRAFAFPQTPVSQLLLLQQQQQQQLQMQQMQQMRAAQAQNMGFVNPALVGMPIATPPRFPIGPPPTQDETNGLMAEQFAIQQQF